VLAETDVDSGLNSPHIRLSRATLMPSRYPSRRNCLIRRAAVAFGFLVGAFDKFPRPPAMCRHLFPRNPANANRRLDADRRVEIDAPPRA